MHDKHILRIKHITFGSKLPNAKGLTISGSQVHTFQCLKNYQKKCEELPRIYFFKQSVITQLTTQAKKTKRMQHCNL